MKTSFLKEVFYFVRLCFYCQSVYLGFKQISIFYFEN